MKHPLDEQLLRVLPSGSLYAVGGRVRDELRVARGERFVVNSDLDYVVTGVEGAALVTAVEPLGRVNIVGASFSVLKLQSVWGDADIALPRRERSTGAGHRDFVIESGPDVSLAEDLGRRDFRMNMIARALGTDLLVDPHGGARDIAAERIDILTEQTFEEDPLRMLRAAQFAGRFEYAVSPRTMRAMKRAAALIATVSAERIGDEFIKLLGSSRRPGIGLRVLRDTGVLASIWPELLEGAGIEQNEWHAFDVFRHNVESLDATETRDVDLRLAALLHDVGKARTKDGPHFYRHEQVGADLIPAMLGRLRLPSATVDTVKHLVRHHMYQADPRLEARALRRFVRRIGVPHLERLFALRASDIAGSGLPKRDGSNEAFEERVREIVAERPPFSVRDLAIGGDDVLHLIGPPAGRGGDRRVGEVLRALFERVTDEPKLNERSTLLRLAREIIGDSARLEEVRDE